MEQDNPKVKEWTEDFKVMSGGEDKFITKEELERYWQRQNKNPSKEDVTNICQVVNIPENEGDMKIGLKEFVDIQLEAEKAPFFIEDSRAELVEALKCFDAENDGTISIEELRGILPDYDDEVLEKVFKPLDKHSDGKLSITELASLLTETMK